MIDTTPNMDRAAVLGWLLEDDPTRLDELCARANRIRAATVGDAIHLRGLVEIGNYCGRNCHYCGIRKDNPHLRRYRLTEDEIIAAARTCARLGYSTFVMQSGEDFGIRAAWLADIVRRIKTELGLAVTLSLGEREPWEWQLWRDAGADRYLLKFETSNDALYRRVHPPRLDGNTHRIAMLAQLRDFGFEVGSGAMVGLPGQSYDDLANDILLFRDLNLDMIGIGPYIPHAATPMGHDDAHYRTANQVPATASMTYKALAIARILCPATNMPSTTALCTLDPNGLTRALECGANVVMPVLTPLAQRLLYEIYPGKARLDEPEQAAAYLRAHLASIGRHVATGPGPSEHFITRTDATRAAAPRKESVPC